MTPPTEGQELALRQLRAIELASPHGLEILEVDEPTGGGSMPVEVSIDCAGIKTRGSGIALHGRERLDIWIPSDFPYAHPYVTTRHTRWAGASHVQWRRHPCLYAAPTIEWLPADGMYGFVGRLFSWLEHAAAGQLDPDDAPLHPPVAYTTSGAPLVIPRVNTPRIGGELWLGSARLHHPNERRYDVTEWIPDLDEDKELVTPPIGAAAALLTPFSLDFEYPRTIHDLLTALDDRGLSVRRVLLQLGWVSAFRDPGGPLLVLLGTAMRRAADGSPRQHLTAWRIAAQHAKKLTDAMSRHSTDPTRRELGDQALKEVIAWIVTADVEWCSVREDRPEVVERRDSQSPLQAFSGRRVAIWGCGALGGPMAEAIVRAGASEAILYDSATVQPGVLVRQSFVDADLGESKAHVLADRLGRIFPHATLTGHHADVLTGPLDRLDWHDGAEIVIDATASATVRAKLEHVRRCNPQSATIITAVVGHTTERGLVTIAAPGYSGAGEDSFRATKLACLRARRLDGFRSEFWPDPPRTDLFQPEAGCSSPTFRGSGAEATALAATLLTAAASDLQDLGSTAIAHLVALPTAAHDGARSVRLELQPAIVLPSDHHRFEVRVGHAAASQIRAGIESARRRLGPRSETGGVLFGERNEAVGVIWIDEATGPPPDSDETPQLFLCGTEGLETLDAGKRKRTSGTLSFLGMWHTHPDQSSDFSARDLSGMLELLEASASASAMGTIIIVGSAATKPDLGAYVFEREELRRDQMTITCQEPAELPKREIATRDIGLALSGGGSRAIAFHLGCLRALHDFGVLDRVRVVSGVSGGSVMTGLWAYSSDEFTAFDARVQELLRRGLFWDIVRRALISVRAPQILASTLVAASHLGPRSVSRTDALRDVLAKHVCGECPMDGSRRNDVDVVINACDLRTGSAFRFGSRESGTWQLGTIPDNQVDLATAIAASAAFPPLVPALDRTWKLERNGTCLDRRIILTDGGVFDNLGTTCLEPGRDPRFSTNVYNVDYIIACDAGQGLLGPKTPLFWPSRMKRSFEATLRKVQDGGRSRLHRAVDSGELRGFLHPYLGQQYGALVDPPAGLIPRESVVDYPTNFSAMPADDLARLSKRGEQLTRLAMQTYLPEL